MRWRGTILILTAALLVFPSALYSQNGYIGIYADPEGTTPCTTVDSLSATVLYVIAKLEGQSANGITGAEYRIEVENPDGWWITYSPPLTPTVIMGNGLDLDPADPGDGSGITLSYSACQVGQDGQLPLGTISVFNLDGEPTNLLVKRHSIPTNAFYDCPLFVLCDSPEFTKACMTPTTQPPCSTLSVPKAMATSTDDPAVFALAMNYIPSRRPHSVPFAETFALGDAELWVMGRKVDESFVTCSFEGETLTIGSISVRMRGKEADLPDERLSQLYGAVPAVSDRVDDGVEIGHAVKIYEAERNALLRHARLVLLRNGTEEARRFLEASPLVERAAVRDAGASIRYRGLPYDFAISWLPSATSGVSAPSPEEAAAHETANAIRRAVSRNDVILVLNGSVLSWNGDRRAPARAQLEHLAAHGTVESAPAGPISDQLLRQIKDARGDEQ